MSTFDRENTATSDVREDLNRMPDRNRVFSPALPLISLTHGGGLKRLSATVGLATALFASAALVTAGLATARPIAPNPVGCPPGQIIVWNLAPPGLDLQQVQQGITDDPWCGSPAQMSPAQGPSPGTPPGGNGASAGTPTGGNGASAGTPTGGNGASAGTPTGGNGASAGTPPGGNGASAGTPPGGNGASAGTPPGGNGAFPDPNQHRHIGKPCSRSNPNCANEHS